MKNLLFLIACATITFSACGARQASNAQLILGKWSISSISAINKEVNQPFINTDGWIKFHTNHNFDADGKPFGALDGEWEINEEDEILTITTNQNKSEDSKWDITFEDKTMKWSNETLDVTIVLTKSSVKS